MPTHAYKPIIVIADDFTGAAEIAGIGLRYGLSSEVQTVFTPVTDARLIVIDSDTRSGSSAEAAGAVGDIALRLKELETGLVYKKTDSVLRGHVTAEVGAITHALGKSSVLLIPANPGMGRIIHHGTYSVNGIRLHKTDFACDPEFPALTSEVTGLLSSSGRFAVRSVATPAAVPSGTIVVGDAAHADDLACWASHIDADCLPAGGGEFFAAVLESLGYTERDCIAPSEKRFPAPSLFVSGSMSGYSREIVKNAKSGGMSVFTVPLEKSHSTAFDALSVQAASAIGAEGSAMLTVDGEIPAGGLDPKEIPGIIAEVVTRVLQRQSVRSLYLTGGATAAAVLRKLHFKRFIPETELRHGVCRMRVVGMGSKHVIVKPGSYPWPDSLVKEYFSG